MADRFEKERAAWVLARAGRRPGARRRGELLALRARRDERDMVGAGDSALTDVATPGLFRRSVMREEGPANIIGWFVLTVSWMFWVGVFAGPAIALAHLAYGLWWTLVPRVGRLRRMPLLVAAVVTAGLSVALWGPLVGDGWRTRVLAGYLMVQVVAGLALAAWLVHARGWAAVRGIEGRKTGAVQAVEVVVPSAIEVPVQQVAVPVAPAEQAVDQVPDEAPSVPEIVVSFDADYADFEDQNNTEEYVK